MMQGGPPAGPVALMAGVAPAYYAPIVLTVMPGRPPRGRAVHPEWNPMADAQKLRSAMKGLVSKGRERKSTCCCWLVTCGRCRERTTRT